MPLLKALPDLRRVGIFSLDIETKDEGIAADRGSAWPWRGGFICGISIAWPEGNALNSGYIPIAHPNSECFAHANVAAWLRDLFASDATAILHNASYDLGWICTEFGIPFPSPDRLHDTCAIAAAVDENQRTLRLGDLCRWRKLDVGKDERILREACAAAGLIPKSRKKFIPQEHIWELPAAAAAGYATADAVATFRLHEDINPILNTEGTHKAYETDIALLPMIHAMRKRGIRIDLDAAVQARDIIRKKRDDTLIKIGELVEVPVSMTEVRGRNWLQATFVRFRITYPKTEKGNASFKGGANGWMRYDAHPLPPLIAAAQRYDHYCEIFIGRQIIESAVSGRVHADIHPFRSDDGGTRTSRFSYSNPPLQQAPKHDTELAPLVRKAFLPEAGETWADTDLNQQEFRLAVHYGLGNNLPRAQEVLELYRTDPRTDFHKIVGEWTGNTRQVGKGLNFGKFYGIGVRLFATNAHIDKNEARRIFERYDQELPFISMLSALCERTARDNGYIRLIDGARRHFNLFAPGGKDMWQAGGPCGLQEALQRVADPNHQWYDRSLWRIDVRNAFNSLIQGTAARQVKIAMRAIWSEGICPILQMHDSLALSVSSPKNAETVARLLCETTTFRVPMIADVKYGRNWGDAAHTWEELHGTTAESATESIAEPAALDYLDPGAFIVGQHPRSLAAALAYAELGWFTFPAPPDGSKKSLKAAKYSDGRKWGMAVDPVEIERDYRLWPNANCGVVTGRESGVWVIEADTAEGHGIDGVGSLRALEAEHGPLPPTLTACSPSGSLHHYFKYPATDINIRNSTSKLAPGVDVRASGGMVLAPPSLRPDGAYTWINNVPPADPPDWLVQLALANVDTGHDDDDDNGTDEDLIADETMVAAAVATIPNPDLNWNDWNRINLAIYGATGGSDAGFEICDNFAQKSAKKYDQGRTRARWNEIRGCPPDRIGAGTLFYLADEIDPDWYNHYVVEGLTKTFAGIGNATTNSSAPPSQSSGNGSAAFTPFRSRS